MSPTIRDGVAKAMRLTRDGRLTEVTKLLQSVLPLDKVQSVLPLDKVTDLVGSLALGRQRQEADRRPADGGSQFLSRSFTNAAGTRPYKLYVPGSAGSRRAPLIVMLHGCTQSADDFAAGTRINAAADRHGFLVAFPVQVTSANPSRCWRWFEAGDQLRGSGEPSLLAGITRDVMATHGVDPRRVYAAGLSAGGAAAAILGATYPDLFAAIGVHSGLPCGAARDMSSGFAAMHHAAAGRHLDQSGPIVPTIVFHGDRDTTVVPGNADAVIAQAKQAADWSARSEDGQVAGGRSYRRTQYADPRGVTMLEQWTVHGAGHAWSGGSPEGSYTDPRGPDATHEMVRFFLEHSLGR